MIRNRRPGYEPPLQIRARRCARGAEIRGARPKGGIPILNSDFLMTDFLPELLWKPSPNFSHRRGTRVDLIVLHDCEGGYKGSIEWFAMSRSDVSAHLVVREDGNEATQMVELADNAWHACAFNQRSVGVEIGGFAQPRLWRAFACDRGAHLRLFLPSPADPCSSRARWRRPGHRLASRSRSCGRRPSRSLRRPGVHGGIRSDGR